MGQKDHVEKKFIMRTMKILILIFKMYIKRHRRSSMQYFVQLLVVMVVM